MKKQTTRVLALTLIMLLLCSLCGCNALDEMRSNQIFARQSGEIIWNSTVYKALPYNEYLYVEAGYEPIYLTEEDVPVLLSPVFYQQIFYASADGRFLMNLESENSYYCNAADYDALCARLEAPFEADILCYRYSMFDEDTYDYTSDSYTLTEAQFSAVRQVVETVAHKVQEDGWMLDYDWSVVLEACSADMLLRRNAMEIAVRDDTYYLLVYTEEASLVYAVPASMNEIFAQILQSYKSSDSFAWMKDEEFVI